MEKGTLQEECNDNLSLYKLNAMSKVGYFIAPKNAIEKIDQGIFPLHIGIEGRS